MRYHNTSHLGRFVRLFITKAGADTGQTSPSVYELEVYGNTDVNTKPTFKSTSLKRDFYSSKSNGRIYTMRGRSIVEINKASSFKGVYIMRPKGLNLQTRTYVHLNEK